MRTWKSLNGMLKANEWEFRCSIVGVGVFKDSPDNFHSGLKDVLMQELPGTRGRRLQVCKYE